MTGSEFSFMAFDLSSATFVPGIDTLRALGANRISTPREHRARSQTQRQGGNNPLLTILFFFEVDDISPNLFIIFLSPL